MNKGTIQTGADRINRIPKYEVIACTKEIARIYNELQRKLEESISKGTKNETSKTIIPLAADLINEENQDKNRGIIEDKEIGE